MKRFYHDTQSTWHNQVLSLLLFLLLFSVFSFGISNISEETSQKQSESLELAINRGIAHCYATEGRYPESLEYLQENYGIFYDSEQYFVDYQVLGSNIFPDVTIIEK